MKIIDTFVDNHSTIAEPARSLFNLETNRVVEDKVERESGEIGYVNQYDIPLDDFAAIAIEAVGNIPSEIEDKEQAIRIAVQETVNTKGGGKYQGKIDSPTFKALEASVVELLERGSGSIKKEASSANDVVALITPDKALLANGKLVKVPTGKLRTVVKNLGLEGRAKTLAKEGLIKSEEEEEVVLTKNASLVIRLNEGQKPLALDDQGKPIPSYKQEMRETLPPRARKALENLMTELNVKKASITNTVSGLDELAASMEAQGYKDAATLLDAVSNTLEGLV